METFENNGENISKNIVKLNLEQNIKSDKKRAIKGTTKFFYTYSVQ